MRKINTKINFKRQIISETSLFPKDEYTPYSGVITSRATSGDEEMTENEWSAEKQI